jgi:catechol 2,3-dioxygenase
MYLSGINHITLLVNDLVSSNNFYTQVLGLKLVGKRPGMHFYSSGHFIHELALAHYPGFRNSTDSGLAHLCFNATDEKNLRALYQHCHDLGVTTSGGVDHTIMHSFYLRDPDNYIIEIGSDRPKQEWQTHSQPFAKDLPLNLEKNDLHKRYDQLTVNNLTGE